VRSVSKKTLIPYLLITLATRKDIGFAMLARIYALASSAKVSSLSLGRKRILERERVHLKTLKNLMKKIQVI